MPTLWVLPTRRHIETLAHADRAAGPGARAAWGPAAVTLDELAQAVCAAPALDEAVLHARVREACAQVLGAQHPQQRALARSVTEVLAAGFSPQGWMRVAERAAREGDDRLRLVSEALRLLADEPVRAVNPVREAARHLARTAVIPAALKPFRRIEFASHVAWSADAIAFVRALGEAARTQGAQVVVHLPSVTRGDGVLAFEPDWSALENHAGGVELVSDEVAPARTPRLVSLADEAQQVRFAADAASRWLAEGVPAEEIAIASRGSGAAMARALERQGIRATDLTPQPLDAYQSIRRALQLAHAGAPEEMPREWLIALVSSTFVNLRGLAPRAPPPSVIARVLRAAGLQSCARDGSDGIDARLDRLERSAHTRRAVASADELANCRATVSALFDRLEKLPRRGTVAEHASAFSSLLDALAMGRQVRETSAGDVRERAAWRRFEELLAQLGSVATTCTRTAFAELLEAIVHTELLVFPGERGAVAIVPWNHLLGAGWTHVVVLDDAPATTGGLWSEDERIRLAPLFGRSQHDAARALDAGSLAIALTAGGSDVIVATQRADSSDTEALARQLGATLERVLHTPLDQRLAQRSSRSIEERRVIARERRAVESGEASPGPHSGNQAQAARAVAHLAPGSRQWPLSPSALERTANCAFQHGADWLWRARIAEEPGDELDVMEAGRLGHLAAEAAVEAIRTADLWHPERSGAAIEHGLQAAAHALDRTEQEAILGHPGVWRLTRRRTLARLRILLERELAVSAETALRPLATELAFGLPHASLPTLEIGGVHVAGRIDRVDVGGGRLHVIDYKSARTSSNARRLRDEVLLETELQLPLYIAAMRALSPHARDAEVDAYFVSLRDAERTRGLFESLPERSFDVMERRLADRVRSLADGLRKGHFTIAPHSCVGCTLRPVCRIASPEGVR